MPSIKQMANRMNAGHAEALERLASGLPPFAQGSMPTPGCIRGCGIVYDTLSKWGAVVDGAITDTGRELISAYKNKWQKT